MIRVAKSVLVILAIGVVVSMMACSKSQEEESHTEKKKFEYLTDIWLVDLKSDGDTVELGRPVNITPRRGYDNQPKYLADGSGLLFSVGVVAEDMEMSTDIYLHDLASGTQTRMTDTEEPEYSPIPMPAGRGFSVVRGEGDGTSRLWFVDDQSDNTEVILPDAVAVNYYNWIDANRIALLMGASLTGEEPWTMTLQIGYVNYGEIRAVAEMPKYSRALQLKPGSNSLTLVRQNEQNEKELALLNLDSFEFSNLAAPLEGSHFLDFVWTEDLHLLMASEKAIYRLGEEEWELLRDYADLLPGPITRLAVRPDNKQLAMVVWEVPLEMPEK